MMKKRNLLTFFEKLLLASFLVIIILLMPSFSKASEFELSGKVGFEQRYFLNEGQYDNQLTHTQASLYIEPELYWSWDDGVSSITFKPFYRIDERDEERTHGDIRELSYIYVGDNWEIRAGIRKEFWGVTEFQHLVDVINQTDGIEGFDGEDKLGQQMLNLSLVKNWGIIDIYLLPGFREQTFAGNNGRLRSAYVVDDNNVRYESSAKENHLDFAARWSHSVDVFDMGVYWFHGTNRDPILSLQFTNDIAGTKPSEQVKLQQHYVQMDQLGFDIQATIDDWLWKFEGIYRSTNSNNFWATQAGFEYTYVGILDSNADLGWLVEYAWDSRGEGDAEKAGSAMQNDLFFGARLALNDIQSTEMLMGVGSDLEHNAFSLLVEANRRLGESVKISLDLRLMQSSEPTDILNALKKDDHIQLSLEWYY